MKTKLKFLVSSALLALTFTVPQATWSAEDTSKSASDGLLHSTKLTSLDDFLQNSPLYHQVSTERYRVSIHTLRQEIMGLQEKMASLGTNNEADLIQQKIESLKKMISLQQEAFTKYGTNQIVAKEKITQEISELEQVKTTNQQNITSNPSLKGFYEDQISKADEKQQICKKYLASLDKSESTLKLEQEGAEGYLKTLDQKSSSAEHLKQTMLEKVQKLQELYGNHVKGVCSSDIFPQDFPKSILETLGISLAQLSVVHPDRLFQLFARSLELPYASILTGENKEEAYQRRLEIVKQNLVNRLREDVFALQLSESIAKNGNVKIDLSNQNAQAEKLLVNPKSLETLVNKEHDLKLLKEIALPYGYGESATFQLLEAFLNASPYGLLGLYIISLEYAPVTSWNEATQIASHTRIKEAKSSEEFTDAAIGTLCHILGRHLNKQVLSKIQETLQGHSKTTTTTTSLPDFYV